MARVLCFRYLIYTYLVLAQESHFLNTNEVLDRSGGLITEFNIKPKLRVFFLLISDAYTRLFKAITVLSYWQPYSRDMLLRADV